MKFWLIIIGCIFFGGLGCRSPRHAAMPNPGPRANPSGVAGKIIYVNERDRYVVVECEVLLSGMKEANVYRDSQWVGQLLLSGPVSYPFMVADVVDGKPQKGDRIQQ